MSILIDKGTRVVVQGITGGYAQMQTQLMLEYGTAVVAGVSPGKGGGNTLGVPICDTVAEAAALGDANAALVCVPARGARDAALEAIDAGLRLVVVCTEGLPVHDTMVLRQAAREAGAWLVGPNTGGLISPGKALVGAAPLSAAIPGPVGLISRSGTLMSELMRWLAGSRLGQSTCVAIGGDLVIGRNPVEYLRLFEADADTRAVLLLGEIGGHKEYEAAEYIATMTTPVVAFVVGRFAPAGKRMGHVGAVVRGESDTAQSKRQALAQAGAHVADTPWDAVAALQRLLSRES